MRTGGTWLREAPGWLFVAAGLSLCVVGVLVPAQRSLHLLHGQFTRISQQGGLGQDRIEAYERFLDRLRHRDPALVRRLAAAELNLVPAGATPVLLSSTQRATVHDWIGRSVDVTTARVSAGNRSWLSWLTDGSRRLWMLGFGVVVVFVGLLVDGRPGPAQFHVTAGVEWSGNGLDEVEDDEEDEDEDELEEEDEEESDEDEEESEEDEEESEEDDDDELDESEDDESEDDDEDDEDEDDEDWEEEDDDDDEDDDDEDEDDQKQEV